MKVTLEHVTKRFGDQAVVRDVSLDIGDGELFFLLGPSGCGKTTLLRCIAGFYIPEQGRILIGDTDATRLPPHQRDTGMVFQSYALWPHMTVRENVAFGLELRGVSKDELRRRVDEALAMVRMTERADYRPTQLSGGQQQRVALARALVIRPKCLLLDEPLSNLDAKLRLEMRTEIRRICKEAGLTAIYVTHDQKEALSVADRLAIFDQGVIQQCGTPREVYERPVNRFVANFIGETNLIAGTVVEADAHRALVRADHGVLVSQVLPAGETLRAGQSVTVSVRPEVIHLGEPPAAEVNVLRGELLESIYLGEMAQHQVAVGSLTVKVFDLHPKLLTRDGHRKPVTVWCRPENVVVLTR
ncbi:MAG: ABC transporter ATP-binding protein [Verrucomicrobiae bacterium]|nr:ABC transporter ATP-binding protein [Verrucomicrobiae bacterium]